MTVPYEEPRNVEWQTRVGAEPSPYAMALADTIESIFADGVHDLDGIVERLNREGPRPEGADQWTAELFESEMLRLGA